MAQSPSTVNIPGILNISEDISESKGADVWMDKLHGNPMQSSTDGSDNGDPELNTISQTVPTSRPKTLQNGIKTDREKNFLLAANYVEDAAYGRTLAYNTDTESLLLYGAYNRWYLRLCAILAMWWLLVLALFEEPAVRGIEVPYWGTILMEIVCLSVIIWRMHQLFRIVPRYEFLHDPKNIVIIVTVLITVIDMIVYIGMMNSSASGQAIRISRVLRPMFIINMNESKQVRRAFRNIRNTVPEIINVLILFLFSIIIFALLAFKLFQYRGLTYRGGFEEPYLSDFWDTLFDLYVLVTTANSPDVMLPAYYSSGWFALFFIAYIIINTYVFMNLLLAVIYNSYRSHLKMEIKGSVLWKQRKMEKAFDLLQDPVEGSLHSGVTYQTWLEVVRATKRPPSNLVIHLFWEVLKKLETDDVLKRQDVIGKESFVQTPNLLNLSIGEGMSSLNFFAKIVPGIYFSSASIFVQQCVQHRFFVYFFDLLIVANAVCIGLDEETSEWFFLAIFIVEILLKIYTYGPKEYFSLSRVWNWFDFIIIMAAFIATIIEAILKELTAEGEAETFPREVLDFLLVMRCLRLVRIVSNVKQFRIIIMTIMNIAPSLLTYGVVLIMLYFAFAIIGMETFGNKFNSTLSVENEKGEVTMYCGNIKLNGSEFVREEYCAMNFNDILHSFVTLFVLTVVNQWHIITLGHTLVTNEGARIFFIVLHIVVVLLIMNIIIAFVLEAFILEYNIQRTKLESEVEKIIEEIGLTADGNSQMDEDDEGGLIEDDDNDETEDAPSRTKYRFRIYQGHKNIEVLLQRMFEGELESEMPGMVTNVTTPSAPSNVSNQPSPAVASASVA